MLCDDSNEFKISTEQPPEKKQCSNMRQISYMIPWTGFFKDMTDEPDEPTLVSWSKQEYIWQGTVKPCGHSATDILRDHLYLKWDEMTPLTRLFVFHNIRHAFIRKKSKQTPWVFQFLMVCLFRGPEFLQVQVRDLLAIMGNVSRWHTPYVFCGGFLREELFAYDKELSEDTKFQISRLFINSDSALFYEHMDNFKAQHEKLSKMIHIPETKNEYKTDRYVPKQILGIVNDTVTLTCHGQPHPIQIPISSVKDQVLKTKIQDWYDQKKS